jgi:F-box protein 18 (helicase)
MKGRATILARTNMRLFESLVKITDTFHVVGGIDEMISQAAAGFALWRQRGLERPDMRLVKNPLVSRHKTWGDLVESSELDEDPETIRLVRIVDSYGERLPDILVDLKNRHVDDASEARFIVSTAHKAKGREWENVIVLDDFPTMFQLKQWLARKRIERHEYDQEINLLYVTMTRAIGTLSISPDLYDEIASGVGLPRS